MAEVECRDCRDFRKCIGKDFYRYQDIKFCRHQVIWVIENLPFLCWPDIPSDDIVEKPLKKGKQSEAYFVNAAVIKAEVMYRLKKTKTDGKLLKAQIKQGLQIMEMEPEAKMALYYCEGWSRRNGSYARWKEKKTYRQRRRNGS